MISKPPQTKDVDLNIFLQETSREFNNYIQCLDIPVSKSGILDNYVHGKHAARIVNATESAYFEFIAPHSLNQVKEVTIRFIPSTTGTIDWTVNLSYGGVGEDENANTKTVTADGLAVTDDIITEINLSYPTDIWTDIDPGDQIGVQLLLDAVTTTTDIQVLSLYFKYI